MDQDSTQSVLRCPQCNKPFDKRELDSLESTLKRHGYYCRSRKGLNAPKARSCVSCVKAKARCDIKQPSCSRCVKKAIECHYPAKTSRGVAPKAWRGDDGYALGSETESSSKSHSPQDTSSDSGSGLDSALVPMDPNLTELGDVDWDSMNLEFASFLDPQANDQMPKTPGIQSFSLNGLRTPPNAPVTRLQKDFYLSNPTIPQQPAYYSLRSLYQRPKLEPAMQRISKLILHNLRSYPQMIIRSETLPPYIHQNMLSFDEKSRLSPLSNCVSLVRMINGGNRTSRKLFWKNVRLECERWCSESLTLDKWELLSALQALTIYVLIRLDEGETEYNNLDSLLLSTVVILSKQFNLVDVTNKTQLATYRSSLHDSWKDWIFEESRRRMCIVYQVLDMLVYFEPAALCDMQADLVLAPLPARKQLWEAADEYQWSSAQHNESGAQSAFGLAANGELVELFGDQQFSNGALMLYKPLDTQRSPSNWEEWCSGMDGFGGLVMLAASLLA